MNKLLRFTLTLMVSVLLAAAEGVGGAWRFVLDTPGGSRIQSVELTVEGETVSGNWGRDKVKGTYREGSLHLEFPLFSDEAGSSGTMVVDGKLEEGKLKGKWAWSQYGGTFVASRPE